ncbi:unnamed protein product [Protopolystoma xenopodis]|uniref:Uncharacterized protein n=1 Tax=Protopolystoma xenopodis TaxID=117903 RepID=A0A448WDW1_9PLAT|nr:unnamed protein product [Protopolystoma xenopodis]
MIIFRVGPWIRYIPRRFADIVSEANMMTNESSEQSHRGRRTEGRGFLRTIQQTRAQDNPPAASGEANLRIYSACLLKRNE